jgi:putative membrane protein
MRPTFAVLSEKTMNSLPLLFAQATAPASWHASSLVEALLYTAVFSLAGTLLAIFGYKLFDYCTPGNLHEEIVKNRNLAAAVIGAAIIIGVSIVVAAAIVG